MSDDASLLLVCDGDGEDETVVVSFEAALRVSPSPRMLSRSPKRGTCAFRLFFFFTPSAWFFFFDNCVCDARFSPRPTDPNQATSRLPRSTAG